MLRRVLNILSVNQINTLRHVIWTSNPTWEFHPNHRKQLFHLALKLLHNVLSNQNKGMILGQTIHQKKDLKLLHCFPMILSSRPGRMESHSNQKVGLYNEEKGNFLHQWIYPLANLTIDLVEAMQTVPTLNFRVRFLDYVLGEPLTLRLGIFSKAKKNFIWESSTCSVLK